MTRSLLHQLSCTVLCCLLTLASSNTISAQDSGVTNPRESIRAMSFNIRLGVAKDGDNHWDKRKEIVVKTIQNYDADIVGTQETWEFQAKYLADSMPDYTYVGRSRQNDNKGEQCGLLFRSDRFDKLIEGHFWLSETPDRPGSKSWDSSLPRMATWIKLWDRVNEKTLFVINTHFDHRGKLAREQGAIQIRDFVETLPKDSHVIVTGDFNASVGSLPYVAMFGDRDGKSEEAAKVISSPVIDTFPACLREKDAPEGTFNGFKGTKSGSRIDWIAATKNWKVISAEIDRSSFNGRYPSDHFPVTAELKFAK